MKVELSKSVRIKKDENYEALQSIEREISNRIKAEYQNEVSALKSENERLHTEDKAFREQAKKFLRNVTPATLLKVQTQVGRGSTIIQEYTGYIEKPFGYSDGTFNFCSPDNYDGRPFTIGLSCLLSIETV